MKNIMIKNCCQQLKKINKINCILHELHKINLMHLKQNNNVGILTFQLRSSYIVYECKPVCPVAIVSKNNTCALLERLFRGTFYTTYDHHNNIALYLPIKYMVFLPSIPIHPYILRGCPSDTWNLCYTSLSLTTPLTLSYKPVYANIVSQRRKELIRTFCLHPHGRGKISIVFEKFFISVVVWQFRQLSDG